MASPGAIARAMKAMPGGARRTSGPQTPNAPYYGNYSPMAQQIMASDQSWAATYNNFLPRPPRSFTEGAFGPSSPILPVPVDVPPDGAERAEARRFEYNVGYNLPNGVPGSEGYKLAPFSTLKTFSELYSVARTCIQLRKSEIRGLDWDIVPTQAATKAYQGDHEAMRDFGERVAKAKKFFRHPDPNYFSFSSWLDAMLDQVLVYDALTLLIRPTWGKGMGKGVLGSDLDSLALINGATVRPLLNLHGESPRPPCYSEDTEILTDDGWKLFSQLKGTEKVATRSEDGFFEWQYPTNYIDFPYEGNMVHFHGRVVDCLVTPDHRMLTTAGPEGWSIPSRLRDPRGRFLGHKDGKDGTQREWIVPASYLLERKRRKAKNEDRLIATSKWIGKELKEVIFTTAGQTFIWEDSVNHATYGPDIKEDVRDRSVSMTGDQYAAFMGAFLSEGSLVHDTGKYGYKVIISQTSNGKGLTEYSSLLKEIFELSPGSAGWQIYRKALWRYFKPFGYAKDKFAPSEVLAMSKRQLDIFLHYYWLGDGHLVKAQRVVATSSSKLADSLQEIVQKTGYSCSVRLGNDGCYRLGIRTTRYPGYKANEVEYSGRVYCVTVPNGVVYVRRNGQPIFSGNCPAYQQFLFGVPRSDFMNMITRRDIEEADLEDYMIGEYRGDQMLYLPMVKRAETPYGFPPGERALIPIMAGLQKQAFQLDYFREGCYDKYTEVLTKDGWRLFSELNGTEEVATRSASGEFQWQQPSAYLSYDFNGQLIEYSNKSMELLVTPGHRMLVRRPEFYSAKHPNCAGKDWHIQLAKHLAQSPSNFWEVPATSRWEGKDPDEDFVFSVDASKVSPKRDVRVSPKDFSAFLGLYISEGWVRKDRNDISIAQRSYSKHFEEIKQILKNTGFNWSYDKSNQKFVTTSKALASWLRENIPGRAWEKSIPAQFKDYSADTLQSLLNALLIGDGHIGKYGQRYYTTTSPRLADDVQEIFQKLGVDAWVRLSNMAKYNSGEYGGIEGRVIKSRRQVYVVRERMQQTHLLPQPKFTEYHDKVYCVTVPNSIVYVRRNGKATWCGNTVPAVYISPGDPNITPNQISELQDALNAFAGDPAWKHKIIVLPAGSKVDPQKPGEIADQFDEIVMTQVCMAYDVNPMELGILPRVSAVASPFAAREMAQSERTIHQRVSTKPTLKYLTDIFDTILHVYLGQDDMHFTFEGLQQETEANALTDMLVKQVQYGLRSVDEARDELELPPWGLPETSGPVVFTGAGPMPFAPIGAPGQPGAPGAPGAPAGPSQGMLPSGAQAGQTSAGQPAEQAAARQRLAATRPGPAPGQVPPSLTPGHAAAEAEMKEPSTSPTRTGREQSPRNRTRAADPDITKSMDMTTRMALAEVNHRQWDHELMLTKAAQGIRPADPTPAIRAELEALVRHLKKGRDHKTWQSRHIPDFIPSLIANQMAMGESPDLVKETVQSLIVLDQTDYVWQDRAA